jgi:PilZ domain
MITMTNRRSELRMMCADMVEVCWRERSGKSCTATALLEDISTSGACLQLEVPVPLGVEIQWMSPRQDFKGCVRYCVYREIGYFVGVEFEPASRWSKKTFTPQHLLDPQSLVGK